MGLLKEFKEFAMRGNVVDLAVGVIIGGAFGKIVSSMVNDILMPPIGMLLQGVDFKELKITLRDGTPAVLENGVETVKAVDPVTLNYGMFIQNTIDFIIVAFCIFMLIKGINRLSKKKEEAPAAPPEPTAQEKLLAEILDELKKQKQ